jgi:predicted choloylglycine hydrolase
MRLSFHAIADGPDGAAWAALARHLWPAYHDWYTRAGLFDRPTYRDCRAALLKHMPELVPEWERLVELAGGGDAVARFLSLYDPPAYVSACSQAVWPGQEPLLVRNYDYTSLAFDGVCLHTQWGGRTVMGTSDCLIGLVDGLNDAGLAVSLTFGGRRDVGRGFGVPIILRYVLQTCTSSAQAGRALKRIPSHMAYNVTVVDAERQVLTAQLTPGRPTRISSAAVATNHQPDGPAHERAQMTATVERERYLLSRLMLHDDSAEKFIHAFLRPPLYSLAFERGFGTLFTAAYWPRRRAMAYHWPGYEWPLALEAFVPATREIVYPV